MRDATALFFRVAAGLRTSASTLAEASGRRWSGIRTQRLEFYGRCVSQHKQYIAERRRNVVAGAETEMAHVGAFELFRHRTDYAHAHGTKDIEYYYLP